MDFALEAWKSKSVTICRSYSTYEEKQVDGTHNLVEIRVPDWDMGPKSNENAKWMGDIKQAVKVEIVEVCHKSITDIDWHDLHLFRIGVILVTDGQTLRYSQ